MSKVSFTVRPYHLLMAEEIWKPVGGFTLYEVSSLGRVRRMPYCFERPNPYAKGFTQTIHTKAGIIDGWIQTKGAHRRRKIALCENGRSTEIFVHRLVLDAFHGPKPFPAAVCRHLNGDGLNCAEANLAWGTQNQNVADSIAHGTKRDPPRIQGEKHPFATLSNATVEAIRAEMQSPRRGLQAAVARKYGTSQSSVWRIRTGLARTAG